MKHRYAAASAGALLLASVWSSPAQAAALRTGFEARGVPRLRDVALGGSPQTVLFVATANPDGLAAGAPDNAAGWTSTPRISPC